LLPLISVFIPIHYKMKKNTLSIFTLCAGASLMLSTPAKSQIFFNNGAEVYATAGVIVQVNGGFQDDNAVAGPGIVDNEGDITVTSLGAFPGNILLSNSAIMQGNGKYHLEQDWINNATFTCNNSTVDMYGNKAEYITSNNATVTTFDTLMFRGAGAYGTINRRKIQTLNANVQGALLLNDRVLWTEANTMFIITPVVTAVTNTPILADTGYVRSDIGGSLSRVTNTAARYFFPVGSDSGSVERYRPVYMKPQAANPDTYTARLGNTDATNVGDSTKLLDTTLCTVNNLFYHEINRTAGVDNADIDIYYDAAKDGTWTNLAQWDSPATPNVWNNMGVVTATIAAPYNDNLKANWNNFAITPKDAYVLANVKPSPPTLNCNALCANSDGSFTVTGNGSSYTWVTPGGTTILSGQGTDSITVAWNGVPGIISVIANSIGGCSSVAASCNVTVNPSPIAGYDTVSTGAYHNTWGFTDTSKANITTWVWNFGDGSTSNVPDPTHYYPGSGTYIVTETVTNAFGCTSHKLDTIVIPEGIIVPNVFTPNGDGKNDVFLISCSGIQSYSLVIYNRWGQEMFTSDSPNISWDGRTNAGVRASDGTYYYILKATSTSGTNWNKTGFIQVLSTPNTGQ
jgi:gliding motility-associated-like protein